MTEGGGFVVSLEDAKKIEIEAGIIACNLIKAMMAAHPNKKAHYKKAHLEIDEKLKILGKMKGKSNG